MEWAVEAVEIGLLLVLLYRSRVPAKDVITRKRQASERQACDVCGRPALSVRTHFGAWRCKKHRAEG
jgi:ribosomal protein L37AE/L43A